MGVLDKVKFWKKEEEPAEIPSYDLGAQHMQADPNLGMPGMDQQDVFNHQVFQQPNQSYQQYPTSSAPFPGTQEPEHISNHDQVIHPRDIELILAKLDAIKAELDSLHQRVRKIEQVTEPQQKKYW